MIRVYRISKPAYIATSLSGQGSSLYPGRWNSRGHRLAYTAGSVALSMLEMLVHVDKEDVPTGQRLLSFDIPEDSVVDLTTLPVGWDQLPHSAAVRAIGDRWIGAASSLALRVPSAVARHESNVLVNPAHPRMGEILQVADEDLVLDPRLFA